MRKTKNWKNSSNWKTFFPIGNLDFQLENGFSNWKMDFPIGKQIYQLEYFFPRENYFPVGTFFFQLEKYFPIGIKYSNWNRKIPIGEKKIPLEDFFQWEKFFQYWSLIFLGKQIIYELYLKKFCFVSLSLSLLEVLWGKSVPISL